MFVVEVARYEKSYVVGSMPTRDMFFGPSPALTCRATIVPPLRAGSYEVLTGAPHELRWLEAARPTPGLHRERRAADSRARKPARHPLSSQSEASWRSAGSRVPRQ